MAANNPDIWWRRIYLHIFLWGVGSTIKVLCVFDKNFARRLREKDYSAQIIIKSAGFGRIFKFENGVLRMSSRMVETSDVVLEFADCFVAARLLTPPIDFQQQIDAQKNLLSLD